MDAMNPPPGSPPPRPEADPTPGLARRMVEEARRKGDRAGEAAALVDLGVFATNDSPQGAAAAVGFLQQAARIFRDLGDTRRQADAQGNLGLAYLGLGRPADAAQVLASAMDLADRSGDSYLRKIILERLAMARTNLGDPASALGILDEAVQSSRAVGDRQHEARLHWLRAIALADLGRRDLAAAAAEESASLMRALGKPEAAWYEEQLRRFRDEAAALPAAMAPGAILAGAGPPVAPAGPGLLRMAISATRAMAAFVASGMKATPAEVRDDRLATCRACEHHTGLRCRVCGCFTEAKSRMAHERCPLGRWPG
ncbi:hypothetical protein OJF2_47230 [Aquisphaera giovannonii]|uniref:Tetratricopeptide repeat protein n=1 Tax=Aquisphaera giovannonii TaxID=406548 RepID=A0A5B9W6C6_9BACT|nr:hypothetical protein [Aquisphaera giovannonii]QEH36163.1 hypothetical protein OJF2_47230 [Aquisphaera giovannonii]